MKKAYTKKQIQEAIAYWEKQLRAMNEEGPAAEDGAAAYVDALRDACRSSSRPDAESGVDDLMDCQPPVSEAEFREMYEDDPSMQLESDSGDIPYDAAMKMFRDGCEFVGFVDDAYNTELSELLFGGERPDFIVAEQFAFGRDEMLLVGFKRLGSYSVTSLWYKPVYKTDVVKAASADAARRQVEEQYERHQKSRAESDELFEGVQDVKPL